MVLVVLVIDTYIHTYIHIYIHTYIHIHANKYDRQPRPQGPPHDNSSGASHAESPGNELENQVHCGQSCLFTEVLTAISGLTMHFMHFLRKFSCNEMDVFRNITNRDFCLHQQAILVPRALSYTTAHTNPYSGTHV